MDNEPIILIIDDDPDLRKTLSDILKAKGYLPIATAKGKTALNRVKKMPAIALIDLKLPDMDGLEVMGEIKKHSPGTECIVLTGYASQASAIKAVNLGAYGYMKKPYDVEQLVVTIHRAIEKREAEEALQESEERFRELIENAHDIIYTHDLEGNFTSANPAATRIYGYPIEEALQLNIADIVDPDYLPLARQKIRKKVEGLPRSEPYELLTHSKEGEPIWVEVSTRLIVREGQPIGVQGIARDITQRKRAEEALKGAALETLEALSSIVEASDPYTSGHSAMVTQIAMKIAQEMGLMDGPLDVLRIAGPLHDVGKVGIPSSVLNKPTGLTQAEWVMIQAHPQVSANVAQQITAFGTAVPVIRHHHERWDGTGYPDGLKGENIPLLARILAVADGFQAMISERPYRRARTEEEALAELEKGAGTQWDPQVVKIFLKLKKSPTEPKGKGKRKGRK